MCIVHGDLNLRADLSLKSLRKTRLIRLPVPTFCGCSETGYRATTIRREKTVSDERNAAFIERVFFGQIPLLKAEWTDVSFSGYWLLLVSMWHISPHPNVYIHICFHPSFPCDTIRS